MQSNQRTILRRVYFAQGLGSTIEGVGLSAAVLYFSVHVGLAPAAIGVVLTVATLLALALVVPIGILADVIGLKVAAVALSTLVVAAFATYAVAHGLWLYAVGACLFMVSQAGLGAIRQAIVADNVDAHARVRGRAVMQTLINAGMGLGTVLGTIAAVAGGDTLFVVAFAFAAGLALICTAILARLPIAARTKGAPRQRPGLIALRDRRFVGICGLASIVLLTMPIVAVLLPLWITDRLDAPDWMAPVTLGLNALLVICTQTRWTARVSSDTRAAGSLALGATTLLAGCALIGAAALTTGAVTATLLAGTTLLTVGEITAGAGMWHLAFTRIPTTAPGQYQAVYGMSSSVARVLGPLAALPLILAAGATGWIVLGLVIAGATTSLCVLALRDARSADVAAGARRVVQPRAA
ncbi:MFS transporter [Solirubrobacter phytolaccae]|uniref:MFS transporter n=1 Tax=Solirubrobacter phytolaccae TaxID=1404360 RepID=A0A9X3N515_9ACTN|nr:MFS transporter [Solirubrobacter phytolaccae]MDA0179774.1 MFS transporter [Solirubrobacter phytolaccae]